MPHNIKYIQTRRNMNMICFIDKNNKRVFSDALVLISRDLAAKH